ncbi:MAG: hypothetical protein B7Z52_05860 [Burkholderiales bacterium 12-64-5]|nr:MAG: hypothetical protein B7Z52_05860 [Burkholderiales bacterium 12-64-5]
MQFFDNSTAANGIFTSNGGTVSGALGGVTAFSGSSQAASGQFTANGGTTTGADGGVTFFTNFSTAASATLIANGGTGGGNGGIIWFRENATASAATIVKVYGNGRLEMSQLTPAGLTIGSLEGDGNVFLGSKKLTLGGGDQSTTFSGVMQDGGIGGGSGGSLAKEGTGSLTLSGTNTYTAHFKFPAVARSLRRAASP